MTQTIYVERNERVANLYFNRPEKLNAISNEMIHELHDALLAIHKNLPKIVFIRGKGRAFSVGRDLNSEIPDDSETLLHKMQDITKLIVQLPVPTIAVVDGYALGAGFELALNCDIILSSDKSVFGFPEVKVGFSITQASSFFLPRLIGLPKAKELLFTSQNISAQKAYELGIVNEVIASEKLNDRVKEWEKLLLAQPYESLLTAKKLLNLGIQSSFEDALQIEMEAIKQLLNTNDANQLGRRG